MTERIYYSDPSCRAFGAVVTRSFLHDGRHAVVLDRSAFYPTSGGQPYDTGWLDAVDVLETIDAGDDILHVVSAPLTVGARVHGEVEWTRRADHMQQHTGQHVLSAAFDRLFENPTTSFHMGAELATIDLARELGPADVERAVDQANAIVWDDRPVSIRFASEEEAARLPLRKEPVRRGMLRLIAIEDFDVSACGGTHVARTGSIGMIAVLGTERFKGGMRVAFACGGRALHALRTYRDAIAGSVRLLSVLPPELPAAIERLQGDARALRKTLGRFQESLAGHEAARLLASAGIVQDRRVVVAALEGWDAQGLKAIASALMAPAKAGHYEGDAVRAALFSASSPAFVVVACSSGCDAAAVLRELTARFGGRGGGQADLAQGGGLTGSLAEMTTAARTLLG
jgi:alanyl-tRNA synthetase